MAEQWVFPEWKGLPLIPSRSAMNELMKYGIDLYAVKQVLEEGYDCAESKRAKGVYEKCLKKRAKIIKVVVADGYNIVFKTECRVVVHVAELKNEKR